MMPETLELTADEAAQLASLSGEETNGLGLLGYDPRWVGYGLLSPTVLRKQLQEFQSDEGDKNPEHYRAATLQTRLRSCESFSDTEVDRILELGQLDPDQSLQPNFPHSLIRHPGLTDAQFELVAKHGDGGGFDRIAARQRLLRGLDAADVTPAFVDRAIADGDAQVHVALLEHTELSRHQVQALAKQGANRAVRNRAAQLLRSRRYRQDP